MVSHRLIVSAVCAGAFALPAFAQAALPVDAGSLLRQDEQSRRRLPADLPTRPQDEPLPIPAVPHGDAVVVRQLRFTGDVALIDPDTRAVLDAAALGHEFDFAGLTALADRVTQALKQDGWLLARAFLPEQDVTSGTITIAISGGRLDSTSAPWRVNVAEGERLRLSPRQLERIARRQLPPGTVLRKADLERAILLMNDLPGINAHAALEAGAEPGSTRVRLDAGQGPMLHPSLTISNFGSVATGRNQLTLGLGLDDPIGWGDRWAAGLVRASGMTLGSVDYDRPLGVSGLRLRAAHSRLSYHVIKGPAQLAKLSGGARVHRVGLAYPLIRSVRQNLWLNGDMTLEKAHDDTILGALNAKTVRSAMIVLAGDAVDDFAGGGRTSWAISPVWGRLSAPLLSGQHPADKDYDSYGTAGQFVRVGFQLSRLQRLTSGLTASADLRGQVAGQNLDSGQKFFPGGPAGVRAYTSGEAAADSGAGLQFDLRYAVPLPGAQENERLELSAFFDAAWMRLHTETRGLPIDTASGRNSYRIAGVGVAAALSFSNGFLRAIWARPVGGNPGRSAPVPGQPDKQNASRGWLQMGFQF